MRSPRRSGCTSPRCLRGSLRRARGPTRDRDGCVGSDDASLGSVVKLVFALHLLFAIFAIGPLVHAATTAGRGVRTGDGTATASSARMLKTYSYASLLVVIAGMALMSMDDPDHKGE